jgi:chemotaxis protein MotB
MMGRSRLFDTHRGGDRVNAPAGDFPRVRIIRPGTHTAVGAVVHFQGDSVLLDKTQQEVLARGVQAMLGKPQKIEIRGHSSLRPPAKNSPWQDPWDLAYQRCRVTMGFLLSQGIERERIRLAVAGPNEPLHAGTALDKLALNPRVEVHLLDETVKDLEGTPGPMRVEPESSADRHESTDE